MNKGRSAKRSRNVSHSPGGHRIADEDIIRCHRPNSQLCIIAIHGGRMEPGTTEMATGIAGTDFSLYSFVSRKKSDAHIRSDNFSEPIVGAHLGVVSIHGLRDEGNAFDIYVGGLDEELKTQVIETLTNVGFNAIEDTTDRHSGREMCNICNRGSSGKGLQLEIAKRLRKQMFRGWNRKGRENTTPLFARFIHAMRTVLLNHLGLRTG